MEGIRANGKFSHQSLSFWAYDAWGAWAGSGGGGVIHEWKTKRNQESIKTVFFL